MKYRIILTLALILSVISIEAQDIDFFTGCEFDTERYEMVPAAPIMLTREYSATPSSFSLKQYCPKPKSQGAQGSCVGWSTTYAARTILEAIANENKNIDNITTKAFAPSYAYNQAKLSTDCSRGSYISEVLEILSKQGTPRLSEFPYECNRTITANDRTKAAKNRIQGYRKLQAGGGDVVSLMKKSISEKKPVVIGMHIYKSFYSTSGAWNGVKDQYLGGHAMCIIGYDDNKYGGAVEILNSWGENWGNNGYIWVRYSDLRANTSEFFELIENASVKTTTTTTDKVDLSGSMKLVMDDGQTMKARLVQNANRDFNIVSAKKSTYKLTQGYSSGTQFRVYISNNQPAYVYLLGYGGTSNEVSQLYPFENFSAYLNYKSNSVAFPNEDYYIQMDNVIGKDYLIVLYSKKELNIKAITQKIQNQTGNISTRVKNALGSNMVSGEHITFEADKISFKAKSKGKNVIPVILEVDHVR